MLDDSLIVELATKAGCPRGWVNGPFYDGSVALREGIPDCLREFVKSILAHCRESA